MEAALEDRPTAVALSFGDPTPWCDAIRDAGARIVAQVQTRSDAARAVDAGADLLVVQGNGAGGHTGTMDLLSFLSSVVERWPDVPVLAAGGIGDGRTLAAALLAGADGAWLGTAFLATPEAVEVAPEYKQLIVDSDGTDTVFTRAHDIVAGLPWPAGIGERVRRDVLTEAWAGREVELEAQRGEILAGDRPEPVRYGTSAGLVPAIRPAAEVVRTISAGAEAVLRRRPAALLA